MEIIYKSIRTINYETQQISAIDTPSAFDDYVAELINHISNNNSVREYKTRSNSTEVIGNILGVCANINDDETRKILSTRNFFINHYGYTY